MSKAKTPKLTDHDFFPATWIETRDLPDTSRARDYGYHPYFLTSQVLKHGYLFILSRFTNLGLILFVVTFFFSLYGLNSVDVQGYIGFIYLFFTWFFAILFAFYLRPKAKLEAKHPLKVTVGEEVILEATVTNLQKANRTLQLVPYGLPPGLEIVGNTTTPLPSLGHNESATVAMRIRCLRRGNQSWHGFRLETERPFGLLRSYRTLHFDHAILVYPRFHIINRMTLPPGLRHQSGGTAVAAMIGESFEFIGNREYRQGDNLRDLDWHATARHNRPIVREYREEYFVRVGVVLDTFIPKSHDLTQKLRRRRSANDPDKEDFERAVSTTASICDYLARADYIVDLFAEGSNIHHITAGRSLSYREQLLDILSVVHPNSSAPFGSVEPALVADLGRITTIVCILLDWDAARIEFVEQLLRHDIGLKIIIVRDRPTTIAVTEHYLRLSIDIINRERFLAGLETL